MISSTKLARQLARELRKNRTPAEKILWQKLRNRMFLDLKFLRQHPIFYKKDNKIKFFIADFYCHEIKLVIEIDGKIHDKQKDYDQIRSEIINIKNIKVTRFTNDEIFSNIDMVLQKLKDQI
jgi:very-short-patch-repair endonuclease